MQGTGLARCCLKPLTNQASGQLLVKVGWQVSHFLVFVLCPTVSSDWLSAAALGLIQHVELTVKSIDE